MIIGAHNHPDGHGYNLEKFLANMAEHQIDKTWLLSWECPADEYAHGNIAVVPEAGPNGPIPFARDFILEFQDRLLYARDYFDGRQCEFLESLDLPESVRAKIYSGNALKLVPLPDAP